MSKKPKPVQIGRRIKALDAEILDATKALADLPEISASALDKEADKFAALTSRRAALMEVYPVALGRQTSRHRKAGRDAHNRSTV